MAGRSRAPLANSSWTIETTSALGFPSHRFAAICAFRTAANLADANHSRGGSGRAVDMPMAPSSSGNDGTGSEMTSKICSNSCAVHSSCEGGSKVCRGEAMERAAVAFLLATLDWSSEFARKTRSIQSMPHMHASARNILIYIVCLIHEPIRRRRFCSCPGHGKDPPYNYLLYFRLCA